MSTRRGESGRTDAAATGMFTLGGDRAVPRLGFGAMRLPDDRRQARALPGRALELGVRLIDPPDRWGEQGRPERLREPVEGSLRRRGWSRSTCTS
jgi:pyridoxine 4-dehydrogenase